MPSSKTRSRIVKAPKIEMLSPNEQSIHYNQIFGPIAPQLEKIQASAERNKNMKVALIAGMGLHDVNKYQEEPVMSSLGRKTIPAPSKQSSRVQNFINSLDDNQINALTTKLPNDAGLMDKINYAKNLHLSPKQMVGAVDAYMFKKANKFENGGSLNDDIMYLPMHEYGGYMMLPKYGFGSWLKENASGLLKGAGSLVSFIPGVGQIAGPVLSVAGAAAGKLSQNSSDKAMIASQQAEITAKQNAAAQTAYQNNVSIRERNMFSDDAVNYGATFALGGDLMMQDQGLNIRQLPSKASKHSEGIGGVPVDIKGNPVVTSKSSAVGMIENGEIVYNGFVFSNSDKMKLKKNGSNTYTS